jgi:hypothetical protein
MEHSCRLTNSIFLETLSVFRLSYEADRALFGSNKRPIDITEINEIGPTSVTPMCTLYTITTNQDAIKALLRVMRDAAGNLPSMLLPDWGTKRKGPRSLNARGSGENLRQEIMDAAIRLLEKLGPEDPFSLRAVANEAGIAAPPVYIQFEDRNVLLLAVLEQLSTR